MKKLLLSLSIIATLVISQSASADGRYWRGYSGWGSSYNYRSYSPYNYGYGYRRSGPYFGVSYGNYYPRYRRRHWDSGSFVGGLVLGSILSYPRNSHRRYETVTYRRPVTKTREVVYVNRSGSAGNTPVASGRRLLKDLEGNCFERVIDEEGNEVRVQLEDSECNF